MKFSSFIFSLFCATLLISSCKKDTITYTFEGYVFSNLNSASLSEVTVNIGQKTFDGTVASATFANDGNSSTNSSGYYEITFAREKVVEFKVDFSKNNYFDVSIEISSSEVSTEEPKIVDQTMDAKAWVNFKLKNIGGMTTDEFVLVKYNFREGCQNCATNGYSYFDGIVDSNFTNITTAGVFTKYSYKAPGSSVYIQDSVFATPFDTSFVTINY